MKTLSLWQPWATFMARAWKVNETRSWSTSYRGLLAIQAAKNRSALRETSSILAAAHASQYMDLIGQWPFGEIVCVVRLVDCVPVEKIRDQLTQMERAMGNYSDGRFAWVTKNVLTLNPTIPYKGSQGLKPISTEALQEIAKQSDVVSLEEGLRKA